MFEDVIELEPIEVSCPSCDSDEGQPCREPRFGQEGILTDFHDSREEAAAITRACPRCRSTDLDVQEGYSETVGDWSITRCDDCGWAGEPY